MSLSLGGASKRSSMKDADMSGKKKKDRTGKDKSKKNMRGKDFLQIGKAIAEKHLNYFGHQLQLE